MFPFLRRRTLTDEFLQTTLCIVENILNDRPLSHISTDQDTELPLTPNMLLMEKRCESLPLGVFEKRDVYSRRYRRQANFIADLLQQYFSTLNTRTKWYDAQQNLRKSDLELIAYEQLHKGQWHLRIVIEPIPSNDELVRSAKVKFNRTIKKARCEALQTRTRL